MRTGEQRAFWLATFTFAVVFGAEAVILATRGAFESMAFVIFTASVFAMAVGRPGLALIREVRIRDDDVEIRRMLGAVRRVPWDDVQGARVFRDAPLRSRLEVIELKLRSGERLSIRTRVPNFEELVADIKRRVRVDDARVQPDSGPP